MKGGGNVTRPLNSSMASACMKYTRPVAGFATTRVVAELVDPFIAWAELSPTNRSALKPGDSLSAM